MASNHEVTRRSRVSRNLKGNRDQLTRAIQSVRSSLEEIDTNAILQMFIRMGEAVKTRLRAGSDSEVFEDGVLTFTYISEVEVLDEFGEPVLDENDNPVVESTTVTRSIECDPSNRFVFTDENGNPQYVHPDGDAPTIKEFVDVVHGMLSYVFYNGDLTAEQVEFILGQPPVGPDEVKNKLDAWK